MQPNIVLHTIKKAPQEILCILQLDALSQQELASRLTLNCMNCYVEPQKLNGVEVTLMDVSMLFKKKTHLYPCFIVVIKYGYKFGMNYGCASTTVSLQCAALVFLESVC